MDYDKESVELHAAAQTLAAIVIEPVPERILPDALDKGVAYRIGEAVAAAARATGVCRGSGRGL